MKARVLFSYVVAVLCSLLLLSGTGLAHHYTILGDDSNKQLVFNGKENRVNYWWALTGASAWWWADSDLQDDAATAVSNWNSAVGLPFYNSSEGSADVTIRVDTSIMGLGAHSVEAVYTDTTLGANYVMTSRIKVNTEHPSMNGAILATITHEIGHFIGLHERYRDTSSSVPFCNSETTVMNGGGCETLSATPSTLDIARVDGMYQTRPETCFP